MTAAERRERATLKRRGSGILETEKQAGRRERARLRSERWRRARGIGPRRPAQKPWLALSISRSTWYRRGNRVQPAPIIPDIIARAEAFVAQMQAELAEVARCHQVVAGIIGEMASFRV